MFYLFSQLYWMFPPTQFSKQSKVCCDKHADWTSSDRGWLCTCLSYHWNLPECLHKMSRYVLSHNTYHCMPSQHHWTVPDILSCFLLLISVWILKDSRHTPYKCNIRTTSYSSAPCERFSSTTCLKQLRKFNISTTLLRALFTTIWIFIPLFILLITLVLHNRVLSKFPFHCHCLLWAC